MPPKQTNKSPPVTYLDEKPDFSQIKTQPNFLGSGAEGDVYDYPSKDDDTSQILKVVTLPNRINERLDKIERIQNEAFYTAHVKNSAVTSYTPNEDDTNETEAYITMPKESGQDLPDYLFKCLYQVVGDQQLNIRQRIQLLKVITEAINKLHTEYEIIHGDLNLSNIFVPHNLPPNTNEFDKFNISSDQISFIDFEQSYPNNETANVALPFQWQSDPPNHHSPDRLAYNHEAPPKPHPHQDWYTLSHALARANSLEVRAFFQHFSLVNILNFLISGEEYSLSMEEKLYKRSTKQKSWQPNLDFTTIQAKFQSYEQAYAILDDILSANLLSIRPEHLPFLDRHPNIINEAIHGYLTDTIKQQANSLPEKARKHFEQNIPRFHNPQQHPINNLKEFQKLYHQIVVYSMLYQLLRDDIPDIFGHPSAKLPNILNDTICKYLTHTLDEEIASSSTREYFEGKINKLNQTKDQSQPCLIQQFKALCLNICEIGVYNRAFEEYKQHKQTNNESPDPDYQAFMDQLLDEENSTNFQKLCQKAEQKTREYWGLGGKLHKTSFVTCVMRQARQHDYGEAIFKDFLANNDDIKSIWDTRGFPQARHGYTSFWQPTQSCDDRRMLLEAIRTEASSSSPTPSPSAGGSFSTSPAPL